MGREASCRAGDVGNGKGWKTKREAEMSKRSTSLSVCNSAHLNRKLVQLG